MRILPTLALLVLTLGLYAQIPDYFAENPEWRQVLKTYNPPCEQTQEFIYYVNGDSIINDTVYKKLYKVGEQTHFWYDDPPIPNWCSGSWTFNDFYTLIRQEEHKIFLRDTWHGDSFVYDFQLNVGDTLPQSIVNWEQDIIITSIDSLLVGNHYRKVFNFFNTEGPYSIIEGIGHPGGFIESFPPGWNFTNLNCFALNSITYYPELNAPCDLTLKIPIEIKKDKIKFYPNPTSKSIAIKLDNSVKINKISAFDIQGLQTNLKFEQIEESSILIDLSSLKNGLYLICLIDNENTKMTIKVIKE